MEANRLRIPRGVNPRMLRAEPMQRCALGDCKAACCLHGVWVDRAERDEILTHAGLVAEQMIETLRDPAVWFDGLVERDEFSASGEVYHTNVLPDRGHYGATACVFLRADYKCALQCAGASAGLHPWRFKPFYCILHPLDLDETGRITLDETSALLNEEGSCLRPSQDGALIPLLDTFSPELEFLLEEGRLAKIRGGMDEKG